MPQKTMPSEKQPWENQVEGWQLRYERHPRVFGVGCTKGNKASVVKPELWSKSQTVKGTPASFTGKKENTANR